MKKRIFILVTLALLTFGVSGGQAALIDLYDWGFNLDGTTYCDIGPCDNDGLLPGGLPGSIDISAFDFNTGLGTLSIEITGAGAHSVLGFFDHEIDEALNTFFNETGSTIGIAAAGQTWEIDEPGYMNGDIFENFQVGALDNGIGTSIYGNTIFPDDVSMAMGWDFALAAGETATIDFIIAESGDLQTFYLMHSDPDSDADIFLRSAINITGDAAIPEPGTLILLGSGLAGLALSRKKFLNK